MLGPLLALIYLNDLAGKTQNESLFYADDTSLYASYSRQPILSPATGHHNGHQLDFNTVRSSLQNDLDTISEFGQDWLIKFNVSKTTQVTFTYAALPHTPVQCRSQKVILILVLLYQPIYVSMTT